MMSPRPKVVRVTGPRLESSQSVAGAALGMPQPGTRERSWREGEKGEKGEKGEVTSPASHHPATPLTSRVRGLRGVTHGAGRQRHCGQWPAPPPAKPVSEKRHVALG